MGVRAIVVNKKKKPNMSLFYDTKKLVKVALLFQQTHHFKPCVPLSCRMVSPKRYNFTSLYLMTECRHPWMSVKDILMKTYSLSTFGWKECKFLCI